MFYILCLIIPISAVLKGLIVLFSLSIFSHCVYGMCRFWLWAPRSVGRGGEGFYETWDLWVGYSREDLYVFFFMNHLAHYLSGPTLNQIYFVYGFFNAQVIWTWATSIYVAHRVVMNPWGLYSFFCLAPHAFLKTLGSYGGTEFFLVHPYAKDVVLGGPCIGGDCFLIGAQWALGCFSSLSPGSCNNEKSALPDSVNGLEAWPSLSEYLPLT